MSDDFHAFDKGRISLKSPFHGFPGRDASNDKRRMESPSTTGDDHTAKSLDSSGGAFNNVSADSDGIAGGERRDFFIESCDFLAFQGFNDIHNGTLLYQKRARHCQVWEKNFTGVGGHYEESLTTSGSHKFRCVLRRRHDRRWRIHLVRRVEDSLSGNGSWHEDTEDERDNRKAY